MNLFVESLYRLYKKKDIDRKKLDNILACKYINQQEYEYILTADNKNDEVM